MRKALSVAKLQSVKDIKKKAKIKKINKLVTTIIIVIIILAVLSYSIYNFLLKNEFDFVKNVDGIKFTSQGFSIDDGLRILGDDKNITIAFNVKVNDLNNLSFITKQIVYLQSVFAAKQKNMILIINTMDNSRKIITCQSNFGDVHTNKAFSKSECESLMTKNQTLFAVDFPDNSLDYSSVEIDVSKKYILIKAKNNEDMEKSIDLILNFIFKDLAEVNKNIENIKQKLDQNI